MFCKVKRKLFSSSSYRLFGLHAAYEVFFLLFSIELDILLFLIAHNFLGQLLNQLKVEVIFLNQLKVEVIKVEVPKKCLFLGLCLEYETFIRGVFCPNLCVCLFPRSACWAFV